MGRNAQEWLESDYPRDGIYRRGLTNHHNFVNNYSIDYYCYDDYSYYEEEQIDTEQW